MKKWPATQTKQIEAVTVEAKGIGAEYTLGLRVLNGWGYFEVEVPDIGDELEPSYHWEDGSPTHEKLDGTSAIELPRYRGRLDRAKVERAVQTLTIYLRPNADDAVAVVLLAGNYAGRGSDRDEVLIAEAEVMAVWRP